jgi:hypothetical protein
MDNSYMFSNVTAGDWMTIILIIWGLAIVWAVATCLITRIQRKKKANNDTDVPGLCSAGCALSGIVGGFCTLNLVMNGLGIDVGFITVSVLFIGGGIIGGSAYGVGRLITPR